MTHGNPTGCCLHLQFILTYCNIYQHYPIIFIRLAELLMRLLDQPGRSTVHSKNGMAATSSPLSTATAIQILMQGGNALDAAIAAVATQCVVEPQSTSIGGDMFCLYKPHDGKLIGFNGSGRAPAAATPEWYAKQGIKTIERISPHSVTIPGAIDGWISNA